MTVLANGNVGVVLVNPNFKLDINGYQQLNGDLQFANSQTPYFMHAYSNGGAIRIRSKAVGTDDRNLEFGNIDNNGAWASYMIVGYGVNVGIGMLTPDQKLTVNGTIHSKSVVVDLSIFADNVFAPNTIYLP